jgi:arylamine N-acetyltransferase
VNFFDNKKTKDRRKESFHKEWESTFSIIKSISDQINDYRPAWISEDTPKFWQTDQFHTHIIIKVHQQDNTYPFEDYHRTNSKNPQAVLMNMLSWWKNPISSSV